MKSIKGTDRNDRPTDGRTEQDVESRSTWLTLKSVVHSCKIFRIDHRPGLFAFGVNIKIVSCNHSAHLNLRLQSIKI